MLAVTRTLPPDGSTHWSTRRLGKHLGVRHPVVHKAWKRANLRPHRLRYLASNGPECEKKAVDVWFAEWLELSPVSSDRGPIAQTVARITALRQMLKQ